jgi:hypothetical protein
METIELKAEYKLQADSGDNWGSAMAAFFGVAGELWWRGETLPLHWEYSPGCASDPREHDDYLFTVFNECDTAVLYRFGNILERYTRNLDRVGESY